MFITLIIFVLILGLLVFVHELGHFLAAKRLGVGVHEFAFGFRPRLLAWKRGETEYAINLIPLGGYVRLEGEQENTGKKSFLGQSPGRRIIISVAGIIMNFVLAWVFLTFSYTIGSYPLTSSFDKHVGSISSPNVFVVDVIPNSPASTIGIQSGDKIISLNHKSLTSAIDLSNLIKQSAGQSIDLQFSHNNQPKEVTVVPRVNPPAGQGALGIGLGEASVTKVVWYKAPWVALEEIGSEIKLSLVAIVGLLSNIFVHHRISNNVSGIVGVGAATGVVRRLGIGPLTQFIAMISTGLAVFNILPVPPLDGGHVLFALLEMILKKPVKESYRQWVALCGLVALGILFLFVTYQDIINFSIIDRIKHLF